MNDEKGISRGIGFTCFSTPEEANKAVSTLHGFMLGRKPLYVAIAQRKEERQAQLQMQFTHRVTALAGPSAAVIPAGYPPLYYAPPGVVSPMSPRQGLVYQTLGMRPGWRPNGFLPQTRPSFQPLQHSVIPNTARQPRQSRSRTNGPMLPHSGVHSAPFLPHLPQAAQSAQVKDSGNQQRGAQAKHMANGRSREMNNCNITCCFQLSWTWHSRFGDAEQYARRSSPSTAETDIRRAALPSC